MWRDISKEIPPFFSAFEMLHAFDLVGHDIKVDLLLSHGLLPVTTEHNRKLVRLKELVQDKPQS